MFKDEILSKVKENEELADFLSEVANQAKGFQEKLRDELSKTLSRPEVKDALPTMKRAKFEDLLSKAADKLGVTQTSKLNIARNSSHREVKIGNFLFVSQQVSSPTDIVRESNFRKTLAASSQFSFAGFEAEENNENDGFVFGVILHGEYHDAKEEINIPFLSLGFPSSDLTHYILNIDLFELFGKPSRIDMENEVVQIEDQIETIFKEVAQQKEL